MKKIITAITLPAALLASSIATANDSGFYGSVGISYSDHTVSAGAADLFVNEIKRDDTGYNFTGGYQFNQYFGVEASYYDFGSVSRSYGDVNAKAKANAWGFAAVGTLPISEQFSLYGKLGASQFNSELKYSDDIGTAKYSDKDFTAYYGIGASFAVTQSAEIYLETIKFDFDGTSDVVGNTSLNYNHDVLNTSLGLRMKF
ncbi:Outer membrane protein A [Sinobacterium norvegicum]|uniref:Outer membrane protein A n=1 Tax=Sinobacterium norvegicum TaxID=1641715 RepID=A0ABM9AEN3_9GAMM|nr:outer membrane beta-barrel protein [Sinobacterium norvegicum]CAH0991546.1 Outer membrane protein A [Sinobacterium norvegicum]